MKMQKIKKIVLKYASVSLIKISLFFWFQGWYEIWTSFHLMHLNFSFSFIYFALITLIPIALSIQAFIMCSWNSGRADPGLLGFYMECNNWPHFKRQHFAAFSCLNATKYGLNTTEHKLHLNALNCSNLWFSLPSSVYMFFCFLESFSLTLSMKAIVLLCL